MNLEDWPNCATPDCDKKVCAWATFTLCYPCAEIALGRDYMRHQWTVTHDEPWEDPPFAEGQGHTFRE